jgi:hypothetical protein
MAQTHYPIHQAFDPLTINPRYPIPTYLFPSYPIPDARHTQIIATHAQPIFSFSFLALFAILERKRSSH